jgi:hypothetical protein
LHKDQIANESLGKIPIASPISWHRAKFISLESNSDRGALKWQLNPQGMSAATHAFIR